MLGMRVLEQRPVQRQNGRCGLPDFNDPRAECLRSVTASKAATRGAMGARLMSIEAVERVEYTLLDLVFVGFNRRVVALDRYNGDVVWDWKSPAGTGFPAILVDGDR